MLLDEEESLEFPERDGAPVRAVQGMFVEYIVDVLEMALLRQMVLVGSLGELSFFIYIRDHANEKKTHHMA